jgi:hypothetical protein
MEKILKTLNRIQTSTEIAIAFSEGEDSEDQKKYILENTLCLIEDDIKWYREGE